MAKPIEELIACARGRLKAKTDDLRACLDEELSERHIFLLKALQKHIQFLKSELEDIDAYLFAAMSPYQKQWEILQTLPGVDKVAAMVLIIEIGIEMERFGSADQLSSWLVCVRETMKAPESEKVEKHVKGIRLFEVFYVR